MFSAQRVSEYYQRIPIDASGAAVSLRSNQKINHLRIILISTVQLHQVRALGQDDARTILIVRCVTLFT